MVTSNSLLALDMCLERLELLELRLHGHKEEFVGFGYVLRKVGVTRKIFLALGMCLDILGFQNSVYKATRKCLLALGMCFERSGRQGSVC